METKMKESGKEKEEKGDKGKEKGNK